VPFDALKDSGSGMEKNGVFTFTETLSPVAEGIEE
jgi:hypothetical protein